MATAAELTGEEIAAVAESLSDPANLNVDTMAAIMHRIGPGLMALGQKVLVALIIFLIGRKVISMIEKMLSRSMEHAGMDVGVTRLFSFSVCCLKSMLSWRLWRPPGNEKRISVPVMMLAGGRGAAQFCACPPVDLVFSTWQRASRTFGCTAATAPSAV